MSTATAPTIGVFDSGFGGLTVLRALLPLIPNAHYIYLGDTARLPYGAKSRETIARYAVEAARFLHNRGADHLVIACNTATALALEDIRSAVPIPVHGVISPGAQAAYDAIATDHPTTNVSPRSNAAPSPTSNVSSRPERSAVERPASPEGAGGFRSNAAPSPTSNVSSRPERSAVERPVSPEGAGGFSPLKTAPPKGASAPGLPAATPQILVLATAATVQSHAYREACAALNLHAIEKACPLLVPLVEEGWVDHPVTREVLRIYLTEALAECTPAAVLLGCTHYPLIADAIRSTLLALGHNIPVIDSAASTAYTVADTLGHTPNIHDHTAATFQCFATDSTEKFQRLGSIFLNQPIPSVTLLNLGG